jgi:hypothetical protein
MVNIDSENTPLAYTEQAPIQAQTKQTFFKQTLMKPIQPLPQTPFD